MHQPPIIERMNKLEEQYKELFLLTTAAIRILGEKGIIEKVPMEQAMTDIALEFDEDEAAEEAMTESLFAELNEHDAAYRREWRRRGITVPDQSAFIENYRMESKRKDAAPAHHYHFVHRILRDICQDGQEFFFSTMADPAENRFFLRKLWQATCKDCATTGKPAFSLRDIQTHAMLVNGFPAIITVMPPPEHINEAYMAAAVLLVPYEDMKKGLPLVAPEVAFITLERSHYEIPIIGAWKGLDHHFLSVTDNMTPTDIDEDPMQFVHIVEHLISNDRDAIAWKTVAGTA